MTTFRFPFNKKQKNPLTAYWEIDRGLQALESETLLFLRNINEVHISCPKNQLMLAKSTDGHFVELLKSTREGPTHRRYLLFSKIISEMKLEDGSTVNSLTVGIGYRLAERKSTMHSDPSKVSDKYEIVPVVARNVYVFFPAEKEVSGLRFYLHASFATDASRSTIRTTHDNSRLMDVASALQVESLPYLREEGFLTTDFLAVLPNSKDPVGDMYQCFHRNLVEAFLSQPFTPKKFGGYAPARQLYRGPSDLSDLFNDEELRSLAQVETVSWIRNANRKNSDSDRFLEDLGVPSWTVQDLICVLTHFHEDWHNRGHRNAVEAVLASKSNAQLSAMYALIEDYMASQGDLSELIDDLKKAPIFRTADGEFSSASDGLVIGVAAGPDTAGIRLKCLHPDISHGSMSNSQKEKVGRFLRRLGIEPLSDETVVKKLVEQFDEYGDLRIPNEQSARYLTILIEMVQRGRIASEIANKFPVVNKAGKYVRLGKTFVDEPYEHTGLACYEGPLSSAGITQLSDFYAQLLSQSDVRRLLEKASLFGVRKRLWLVETPIIKNPFWRTKLFDYKKHITSHERGTDWDIPGLDKFAELPTRDQAKLVWEFVTSSYPLACLEAEYRANSSDPGRSAPAKYIYTLTRTKWIPVGEHGGMEAPENVSLDQLPSDWKRPRDGYDNSMLKAIKFGAKIQHRIRENEELEQTLRRYGVDGREEFENLKKIKDVCREKGMTLTDVLSKINLEKKSAPREPKQLPKQSAADVRGRMSIDSEKFKKASDQTYIPVVREVHVGNSGTRDAARTYLRSQYEIDGEMFCQLCHSCMPFRGRDGKGYFEATQVFTQMKKDIAEQFLSLCPTCRAKYDEWVRRSRDRSVALRNNILAHQPIQGEDSVTIQLPGEAEKGVKSPLAGKALYFTGTHFLDLRQAVYEDEKIGGLACFGELESTTAERLASKSFVEWYLSYDPEGDAMVKEIIKALSKRDSNRQRDNKIGFAMWSATFDGYIKKVLACWPDYHSQYPFGETQADAGASLEQYCRARISG